MKIFVNFFSGIAKPTKSKLGTHVNSGQMYRIYWNQDAVAYSSIYFFIFLSLQFSNIKHFGTLFSGTVQTTKL